MELETTSFCLRDLSCSRLSLLSMAQEDRFQVGLIQLSCSPDPDANLRKAVERVREAGRNGAQMICLPELFRTQYFCQREDPALFDLAETIPGPTTEAISKAAVEAKAVVVASIFEKRAPGLYHNTAVLIGSDGSIKGLYRKMHIPDDPLYYEKYYFTPGDLGFKAFDTEVGRMAPSCAGISGIPKERGSPPSRAPRCCSIQRPSLGTRQRKSSMEPHNTMHGARFSDHTPLPMASSLRLRTELVMRPATSAATKPRGRALISGEDHSSPILSVACSRKPRTIANRSYVPR